MIRPFVPPRPKFAPARRTSSIFSRLFSPRSMPFLETDMGWGPEYGPWNYQLMSEPFLTSELTRLSFAKSIGKTHCITFQPCPDPDLRSQDRYSVLEWPLANGKWTFTGVFDGHGGEETAEHVVNTLPLFIKERLSSAIQESNDNTLSPTAVSEILMKAISNFDNSIIQAVIDIFPGGSDAISDLSNDEISAIINDSGENSTKVLRAMRGSTAIISLVDPNQSNLWIASLGDCQAVMGIKTSPNTWSSTLLSSNHNGKEEAEAERIKSEHPGEEECMVNSRVLGSIAVTRAIGDCLFKLPRVYTERVFLNSKPGFKMTARIDDIIPRVLTPPYLSNQAEVQHVDLSLSKEKDRILILCSDGLMDLYGHDGNLKEMAEKWIDTVGNKNIKKGYENDALRLLRDGLGGKDEEKVSRMLTVEMPGRWTDDTTIIVQRL